MTTEEFKDGTPIERIKFERWLTPGEGSALITQPGVAVEPVFNGNMVFDGDVLLRFWLPDGGCVEYTAEMESDYYGGEYTKIKWSLWSCAPPDSPDP